MTGVIETHLKQKIIMSSPGGTQTISVPAQRGCSLDIHIAASQSGIRENTTIGHHTHHVSELV